MQFTRYRYSTKRKHWPKIRTFPATILPIFSKATVRGYFRLVSGLPKEKKLFKRLSPKIEWCVICKKLLPMHI